MSPLSLFSALLLSTACGGLVEDPEGQIDAGSECHMGCASNAECIDGACRCKSGYELDGESCVDIDECARDKGGCDSNASCSNIVGSYVCQCNNGFVGDGESCTQVWEEIGRTEFDLLTDSDNSLASVDGAKLFFASQNNNAARQSVGAFDLNSRSFDLSFPLPPTNEVGDGPLCNCGANPTMVGSSGRVYLFHNRAYYLSVEDQTWQRVESFTKAHRRSSAAGVFVPDTNKIFLIGGTDSANSADQIELSSGTVFFHSSLPAQIIREKSYFFSDRSIIAVTAQESPDSVGRVFTTPSTESGNSAPVWEELSEGPVDFHSPLGIGRYRNRLWVATRSRGLYFYDFVAEQWTEEGLPLPSNTAHILSVADDAFALAQEGDSLVIYQLLTATP